MASTLGSIDLASLKNLRDDVTQYFWFESNSSSAWGSGAHVTLYPESQFTDSTSPNYMKGQNIIMNTDGFSIRNGALPMMVLDNDSLDFYTVDTTQGTYTALASFGVDGAVIGRDDADHIEISDTQIVMRTGDGLPVFSIDDSTATIKAQIKKTVNVGSLEEVQLPISYTLDSPEAGQIIVTCSFTYKNYLGEIRKYALPFYFNYGTTYTQTRGLSGICDISVSYNSSDDTVTIISYETAPDTTAVGIKMDSVSYYKDIPIPLCSIGVGIDASGGQFCIGQYNNNQSDSLFEIGNGTADNARSNALTVDWDGHVVATSAKKNVVYTGEYIMLYGNQTDISVSAGQVALSTTTKNCLPANKYSTFKSPLADDLYSVSNGEITILKAGRYRLSGQIYLYNGFAVDDVVYCSILSNGSGANVRASRCKAFSTALYETLSADTITDPSSGTTYTLASNNGTAARGIVGINGYTRFAIECLGIYES